jgi:dihydrofolate reductase
LIRAIFACDEEWGIGKDGTLPWPKNSEDLKWFQKITTGCVVVMGRKTWESLTKKPLPNRNNIVVTSEENPTYGPYHFVKYDTYKSTIEQMSKLQQVWLIGGAQLFEDSIEIVDEIWLSRISGNYNCDVYLPRDTVEQYYVLYSSEQDENGLHIEKWRKL